MEWVRLYATPPYYLDGALLRAGEAAEVLFCRGLAYCGNAETGGRIDKSVVALLAPQRVRTRVQALLREGLWIDCGDHYTVRSWEKLQQEHDAAAERRATDRERKRLERRRDAAALGVEVYRCYDEEDQLLYVGVTENVRTRMRQHARESRWFSMCAWVSLQGADDIGDGYAIEREAIREELPVHNVSRGGMPDSHHARPVTSQVVSRDVTPLEVEVDVEIETTPSVVQLVARTDATQASPKSRRGTQIPEVWPPNEDTLGALRSWAVEHAPGVDLRAQTDQWIDYHRAKGDTAKDWAASWRTWMRRAQEDVNRGRRPGLAAVGSTARPSTRDRAVAEVSAAFARARGEHT